MPKGIPVATFAIGESGSYNAGLFAVSLISLTNKKVNQKLKDFRKKQVTKVLNMKINEKAWKSMKKLRESMKINEKPEKA